MKSLNDEELKPGTYQTRLTLLIHGSTSSMDIPDVTDVHKDPPGPLELKLGTHQTPLTPWS